MQQSLNSRELTDSLIADNFQPMKMAFAPILWLFVAVLFIRAMIPAGFMPDMSGKHILTICAGMGTSVIIVDDNNQPVSDTTHPTAQTSLTDKCPFASLTTASLGDPNIGLPFLIAPELSSDGMTAFILAGVLPISLENNHLSRAPPQFS